LRHANKKCRRHIEDEDKIIAGGTNIYYRIEIKPQQFSTLDLSVTGFTFFPLA